MKLIDLIEHAQNEARGFLETDEPITRAYEAGEAAYRAVATEYDEADEIMYAAAFEAVVIGYLKKEEAYWRGVFARERPTVAPEEPEVDALGRLYMAAEIDRKQTKGEA